MCERINILLSFNVCIYLLSNSKFLVLLSAFINFYKREDHIFLQLLINQSLILVFGLSPIKTMNFKLCRLLVLFFLFFFDLFSTIFIFLILHVASILLPGNLQEIRTMLISDRKKSGVL